ncbi:Transcription_elongation factor Ef1 like domain-containing protein [Hexamita inflata]|uniref:Transcription elongation factor 1 homolog n=2 Tax=Hexamita inflata TaxID=28002 RepID=A0AA86U1Z9_9EUKA|nr:Transcription elongation factor Ef1 like domain-containing protein [Hexamita inflata]
MGKKRKAQEVQSTKPKQMKIFNCPVCKNANSVKISMKKQGTSVQAECNCSHCNKSFAMKNLSLLETEKNAYMYWVTYVREQSLYGARCPECKKYQGVVEIVLGNNKQLIGRLQCVDCEATILFDLKENETRDELCIRVRARKAPYSKQELNPQPAKKGKQNRDEDYEAEDKAHAKQSKRQAKKTDEYSEETQSYHENDNDASDDQDFASESSASEKQVAKGDISDDDL